MMRTNQDFLSLPEISRFGLVPVSTLRRMFSTLGIEPDQVVTLGRGRTPLFRRSRLPELLASIQIKITQHKTTKPN